MGLHVSGTYTAQSGVYYPRIVQVRNALHQLTNVTVQGHAGRYSWIRLLDARTSKVLQFGRQRFEVMLDAFNVLNTSVVLQQVNTNGPNYLKPCLAVASMPQPPRQFRRHGFCGLA